jgi:predicted Zn finger-like uncharacterized protein
MSGGNETLMRTRCPECGTVFRVTSEQLRRKAGKVRCGHCQAVFNAFDHWQSDADETLIAAPVEESVQHLDSIEPAEPTATVVLEPWTEAKREPEPEPAATEPVAFDPAATVVAGSDWVWNESMEPLPESSELAVVAPPEVVRLAPEQEETPPVTEKVAELASETDLPVVIRFDAAETLVATPAHRVGLADDRDETPEQSTSAAREAGLVAARELAETNSYNRWSAGTLASDGRGTFGNEPATRAIWPFVVVSVLLLIALLGQLAYHYRTDIVMRLPALQPLYASLSVDIPLPRNPALVSIETSDLQSDNARGLFVLQATLKNRASFPQAWPALELSLTDTNDAIVSRRVMYAAEYLPPGTTSDAFSANGDVAVRLWIEAKDIGASGYRLYIFYP